MTEIKPRALSFEAQVSTTKLRFLRCVVISAIIAKLEVQTCYFKKNVTITSVFLLRNFLIQNLFKEHIQVTASAT